MSHVMSMHRLGGPKQTAHSGLPEVILCLVALRFEYGTLVVRAKQDNHSAIAANNKKL